MSKSKKGMAVWSTVGSRWPESWPVVSRSSPHFGMLFSHYPSYSSTAACVVGRWVRTRSWKPACSFCAGYFHQVSVRGGCQRAGAGTRRGVGVHGRTWVYQTNIWGCRCSRETPYCQLGWGRLCWLLPRTCNRSRKSWGSCSLLCFYPFFPLLISGGAVCPSRLCRCSWKQCIVSCCFVTTTHDCPWADTSSFPHRHIHSCNWMDLPVCSQFGYMFRCCWFSQRQKAADTLRDSSCVHGLWFLFNFVLFQHP